MKLLLPIFASLLLMTACKSQQYTPNTYEERQIVFGGGGGFTGAVDTWCLLDNGQLFHKADRNASFEEVKKVGKKTAAAMFTMVDDNDLAKIGLQMPGNIYSFVEIKTGSKGQNCTWDPYNAEKIPEAMKELHKELMGLTKAAK